MPQRDEAANQSAAHWLGGDSASRQMFVKLRRLTASESKQLHRAGESVAAGTSPLKEPPFCVIDCAVIKAKHRFVLILGVSSTFLSSSLLG